MKEYKAGDTIYVQGKINQIDKYDTSLPYCVDFENGTVWISSDNIIDELPTAEPVNPVLPEKVVLSEKQAEIVENARDMEYPANYITKRTFSSDDEILLMNAYVNGWTVEKQKRYFVRVPYANRHYYYQKCDSGEVIPVWDMETEPPTQFTLAEIEHYGLQDCEKMEVKD